MDANDLYAAVAGSEDPYSKIRPVVDELASVDMVLTDEERAYLRGAQTNMAMNVPLGKSTERNLSDLCVRVRQRLHAGS